MKDVRHHAIPGIRVHILMAVKPVPGEIGIVRLGKVKFAILSLKGLITYKETGWTKP